MVIQIGFEPTTHSLGNCCSIQLSYWTIFSNANIRKIFVMTKKVIVFFVCMYLDKYNITCFFGDSSETRTHTSSRTQHPKCCVSANSTIEPIWHLSYATCFVCGVKRMPCVVFYACDFTIGGFARSAISWRRPLKVVSDRGYIRVFLSLNPINKVINHRHQHVTSMFH